MARLKSIIVDRVALTHHPATEIISIDRADRNNAIPMPVAGHMATVDEFLEREGSIAAAPISFATGVLADLACFEGIHAREANALALDVDRVAVDHRGLADDRIACMGRQKYRQR